MPPDVLVVLPTYNEAATIDTVVAGVRAEGADVLIVDDASPDGTGTRADALAAGDDGVRVLHRSKREGLGRAYGDGFGEALATGAAVVCQMDADMSHAPGELGRLVAAIADGADVAIGSRYVAGGAIDGWSWLRRIVSYSGNLYVRTLLRLPVRDATSGFRAHRSEALRLLDASTCRAVGYGFQVEMTYRSLEAGLRVVEVPITFVERAAGTSKMTMGIAVEAALLVTWWGLVRIWRRLRSAIS